MKPTGGEIRYDGIEIGTMGEKYRDIFGYLPQEFGFYPGFSVQDYLEYMAALKGIGKRETKEKIQELLELVSLTDVRKKKISKLSGGMKRLSLIHIYPKVAKEAFINVNDGTNEGLAYEGKNIFTVQFHPEACPGPLDSGYLFDRFMDMMKGAK